MSGCVCNIQVHSMLSCITYVLLVQLDLLCSNLLKSLKLLHLPVMIPSESLVDSGDKNCESLNDVILGISYQFSVLMTVHLHVALALGHPIHTCAP